MSSYTQLQPQPLYTPLSAAPPAKTSSAGAKFLMFVIVIVVLGAIGVGIWQLIVKYGQTTSSTTKPATPPPNMPMTGGTTTTPSMTATTPAASGTAATTTTMPPASTTTPSTATSATGGTTATPTTNTTTISPNNFNVVASGQFAVGSVLTAGNANNTFTIPFGTTLTAIPDVICTPVTQPGQTFPDTFVDTVFNVTLTGFSVSIVRVDYGAQAWGQNLQLDWIAYNTPSPVTGIATLGPSSNGTAVNLTSSSASATGSTNPVQAFTYQVSYGATFSTTPNILCTPLYANGTATFAATVYNITPTGFSVQIIRNDVFGSSWTGSLQLAWLAFTLPSTATSGTITAGIQMIGPNTAGGLMQTGPIAFSTPFTNTTTATPVVVCTPLGQSGLTDSEVFATGVYNITNTGFNLNILRVDNSHPMSVTSVAAPAGAWTQNLMIAYIAYMPKTM